VTKRLRAVRLEAKRLLVVVLARGRLLRVLPLDNAEVSGRQRVAEERRVVDAEVGRHHRVEAAKTLVREPVVRLVLALLLDGPVEVTHQVLKVERHTHRALTGRALHVDSLRAVGLHLFKEVLALALQDRLTLLLRQVDRVNVARQRQISVLDSVLLANAQRRGKRVALDNNHLVELTRRQFNLDRLVGHRHERQRKTGGLGEPKLRVDKVAAVRQRVVLQRGLRVARADRLVTRAARRAVGLGLQLHPLTVQSLARLATNEELLLQDHGVAKRVGPVGGGRAGRSVGLNTRAHKDVRKTGKEIGLLGHRDRNLAVKARGALRRDLRRHLEKVHVAEERVHKERNVRARDNRDVFDAGLKHASRNHVGICVVKKVGKLERFTLSSDNTKKVAPTETTFSLVTLATLAILLFSL